MWDSRFMRRVGYEGQTGGSPWRILPQNEAPTSNLDEAFKTLVMEKAAKTLGMNPSQLKATVSQFEMNHWETSGWNGKKSVDGETKVEYANDARFLPGNAGSGQSSNNQESQQQQPPQLNQPGESAH